MARNLTFLSILMILLRSSSLYAAPSEKCINAASSQLFELARQLKDGALTPAQYLQRIRDRSAKMERCRDESWSVAYDRGDSDGDLVPDEFDRCPNTPMLVATDESGCPVPGPTAEGPSPQDVRRFFDAYSFVGRSECAGAPVPTVPGVVKIASVGFPTENPPKLHTEFRKVINQPTGCPVIYQVFIEEIIPVFLSNPAPRIPEHLTFRLNPNEALNASDPTAETLVFESVHPRLVVLFHWGAKAKVSAVNGSGSTSAWSQFYGRLGR
jgi:hypothetical protein